MLAKSKKSLKSKTTPSGDEEDSANLKLRVSRIKMMSYETYHHQVNEREKSSGCLTYITFISKQLLHNFLSHAVLLSLFHPRQHC